MKGVIEPGARRQLVGYLLQQSSPELLIVDEPTNGLDPTERHRFLNLLAEISEEIVVILSTHIVEDVRELCRAMAIINRGRVVLAGDPRTIVRGLEDHIAAYQ